MLAGNLFELRELAGVKLMDFEVPPALGAAYAGPQGRRAVLRSAVRAAT
ncbi:MAG: hypothetical protein JOZ07_18925 [Solirubrobacterales bacterium]|nr:hypothetical protein [Solirubrobacterales bacterium]